jgi:hypothetical protein
MKKPQNRMEHPSNREEDDEVKATIEELDIVAEEETTPKTERGYQCKWCKVIGNNEVRRTYKYVPGSGLQRLRFCRSCRREFQTFEK